MIIFGQDSRFALVLNIFIKRTIKAQREALLLKEIINHIALDFSIDEVLYWTTHQKFTKYFDETHIYSIYEQSPS